MSIASRIEAIEEHLTDDYSVLTLAGADLTNVDKNIINLKPTWKERLLYFMNNGTQVVWNNWNKVSGTGTSLTLNNTEEAPMSLTYKGNTSQTGTPTPSSPIPVQVVSGDNSIEVVGKNLLGIPDGTYTNNGITANISNGEITLNGTATGTSFIIISLLKNIVLSNQTITISTNNSVAGGDNLTEIRVYTSGSVYMACRYDTINNSTTYTNRTNTYTGLQIRTSSGVTYNNFVLYPQVELGSTATTYKPYKGASYPISLGNKELCKIGTYQDKIDKSTGKNLFDKNTNITQNTGLTSQGGTFSSTTYCVKEYLKVEANTTYTLHDNSSSNTKRVCFYTGQEESSFISVSEVVSNKKITFTTPTNCQYIRIQINQTELDNEMLNEGSTALPYEPYGTNWYLKKETGKVILDGSESWEQNWNSTTNTNGFVYRSFPSASGFSSTPAGCMYFSNRFHFSSSNRYDSDNELLYINTSNASGMKVSKTNAPDLATFKTWLGNNNVSVYYVLATPTYETITDTTLISQLEALKKSYESVTNISQVNNDLPFELDVTALEEMN